MNERANQHYKKISSPEGAIKTFWELKEAGKKAALDFDLTCGVLRLIASVNETSGIVGCGVVSEPYPGCFRVIECAHGEVFQKL